MTTATLPDNKQEISMSNATILKNEVEDALRREPAPATGNVFVHMGVTVEVITRQFAQLAPYTCRVHFAGRDPEMLGVNFHVRENAVEDAKKLIERRLVEEGERFDGMS